MHIFLVSFQSLDDASVSFQAALPQLIQVIHHIIVRLKRQQESMYEQCPWWSVHSPYSFMILMNCRAHCCLTLSTCACEACWRVFSTTSRYFLNSPPIARAISPNTERICGFTDLWTFSFWKRFQHHYIQLHFSKRGGANKLSHLLET